MKIFTIGVYNSSEEAFFNKLIENRIDTFCDIRQRRGVRGSEYKFVNSNYLQSKLADMNIRYGHILDLAPTKEIREKQWAADAANGEKKKTRLRLGAVFTQEYNRCILCNFDFDSFIKKLEEIDATNVVLFCVEENADACHRSLVASELNRRYGFEIINL